MLHLPSEVQYLIMERVSYPANLNLPLSCKRLNELYDDNFWQQKCRNEFSDYCETKSGLWKNLYNELHLFKNKQLCQAYSRCEFTGNWYTSVYLPSGIIFWLCNHDLRVVYQLQNSHSPEEGNDLGSRFPIYNSSILSSIIKHIGKNENVTSTQSPRQLLMELNTHGVKEDIQANRLYHQGISELKKLAIIEDN